MGVFVVVLISQVELVYMAFGALFYHGIVHAKLLPELCKGYDVFCTLLNKDHLEADCGFEVVFPFDLHAFSYIAHYPVEIPGPSPHYAGVFLWRSTYVKPYPCK